MRISDLVASVSARFEPLLVEQGVIQSLTIKALSVYQTKAGSQRTIRIQSNQAGGFVPPAFLHPISCTDRHGGYVQCDEVDGGIIPSATSQQYPLTYTYGLNLVAIALQPEDEQGEIPSTDIMLIMDYLECLIGQKNDQLLMQYESGANMDISSITASSDWQSRLERIEDQMAETQAFIAPVSIYPC